MEVEKTTTEPKETQKVQPPVDDKKETAKTEAEGDSGSDLQWNEKQQAYLKKLREENARYRTSAKTLEEKLGKFEKGLKTLVGGEDEQVSPEEQLEQIKAINETYLLENSLKDMALEHGLNKSSFKYFKYLMNEKFSSLDEGEEISEEEVEQFVVEAKRVGGQTAAKTSVKEDSKKEPSDSNDEVTVEEFMAMGIVQKSMLYEKNKALYDKLYAQSRKKK